MLKRGAGGRIKELENFEVLVDQFAPVGEKRAEAAVAVCEKVYKKYDVALREEVSDIRCTGVVCVSHTHCFCRSSILLKNTCPHSHLTPTLTLETGKKEDKHAVQLKLSYASYSI